MRATVRRLRLLLQIAEETCPRDRKPLGHDEFGDVPRDVRERVVRLLLLRLGNEPPAEEGDEGEARECCDTGGASQGAEVEHPEGLAERLLRG